MPPLPVGVVEDKLMESPLRRSRSLPQVIPSRPMTCDARPMTADEVFIAKVVKNLESLVAGRKPVVLVSECVVVSECVESALRAPHTVSDRCAP